MALIDKQLYTKRRVIKLNLPTTVEGVTTYYAIIWEDYALQVDTETSIESEVLKGESSRQNLENLSKQEVIDQFNQEKDSLTEKYQRELDVLTDMIDQLEGE